MISASNLLITNGTFNQNSVTIPKGFDLLSQNVATQALHDSGELSDPVKCHPDTRVAILTSLEEWAESHLYDYPIKSISGSAGVGKTAIMHTTAKTLAARKLLLASFFFWRSGERCNTVKYFFATLAYQIAISIPATRPYIENVVEEDPHIFSRTLEVQSQALIVNPISTIYQEHILPSNHPRIFVIDGLDECMDGKKHTQDVNNQREILKVLHWTLQKLPAPFALLIASRPEYHIQTMFNTDLKDVSSVLVLNDAQDIDADIEKYFVDKFRAIREHHPLRSYLPSPEWPSDFDLQLLVHYASGQFIYATTVVKFVGARKKNPFHQLNAILRREVQGNVSPFLALDVLYSTIFSVIDDDDLGDTLRILGALALGPIRSGQDLAPGHWDEFLGLQEGEVERLMLGLESLLLIRATDGRTFCFYHGSLFDFLFNSSRSGRFFLDQNMVVQDLVKLGIHHLLTSNDDIGTFVASNIEFWLGYPGPSIELHNVSEQFCCSIHPQHLQVRYPPFLKAIHGSKLPERETLCDILLDLYRSHLSQIIPMYFKDESLAFLLIVWLTRGQLVCTDHPFSEGSKDRPSRDSWTSNPPFKGSKDGTSLFWWSGDLYFVNFIDQTCPLSSELRRIDREQGFYLYQNIIDDKPQPILKATNIFIFVVAELINEMPEAGNWYSKVASILVESVSKRSALFLEQYLYIWTETFMALEYLLPRASTQSGLRECLENNPIPQPFRSHIQKDIKEYIMRDRKSENEAGGSIEGSCARKPKVNTGIWVPWADSSELGRVVDVLADVPDIDE